MLPEWMDLTVRSLASSVPVSATLVLMVFSVWLDVRVGTWPFAGLLDVGADDDAVLDGVGAGVG